MGVAGARCSGKVMTQMIAKAGLGTRARDSLVALNTEGASDLRVDQGQGLPGRAMVVQRTDQSQSFLPCFLPTLMEEKGQ